MTALLGILSGIVAILIGAMNTPQISAFLPTLALGLISLILGGIGYVIADNWMVANKAGRAYLNMRWATIRAIEYIANQNEFSVGSFQQNWSAKSDEKTSSTEGSGDEINPLK